MNYLKVVIINQLVSNIRSIVFLLFLLLIGCHKDEVKIYIEDITPKAETGSFTFIEVKFRDAYNGYVLAYNNTNSGLLKTIILNTQDGGKSWKINSIPNNVTTFQHLFLLDNDVLFASSIEGLYRSNYSALTWTFLGKIGDNNNRNEIVFFDNKEGVALNGKIYKTNNGGATWNTVFYDSVGSFNYVNQIQFPDNKTGYAYGGIYFNDSASGGSKVNIGRILKTTDKGNTWTKINKPFSNISNIYFLSADLGFVFTVDFQLFKTEDGALNWTLINNKISDQYLKSYFINAFDGVYCGSLGAIFRTRDGGLSWNKEYQLDQTFKPQSWVGISGRGNTVFLISDTSIFKYTFS